MRRKNVTLWSLGAVITGALFPFGGCLMGCVSEGAGWTFNVQTAGFTIEYENRPDKDGVHEFRQTFDEDGMNILTGAITSLREEADTPEAPAVPSPVLDGG